MILVYWFLASLALSLLLLYIALRLGIEHVFNKTLMSVLLNFSSCCISKGVKGILTEIFKE
jgi:hypothetical protein